ncbi:MAG: YIP1 family protein [Deltaproteobacteria bacterium]|nr:YIP1 family protein [Deltaproteobacteria bacterium]
MTLPQLAAGSIPPPPEVERSPFVPRHLVDLFMRPRRFFTDQLALGHTPYLLFVIWVAGVASTIGRFDRGMLEGEIGGRANLTQQAVSESWLAFWAVAAGLGAIGGAFYWWLGGWWFTTRLRWSGAVSPERKRAKLVMIYADFIAAAPTVLSSALMTLAFPSYAAAFHADAALSDTLLLIFPFWSVWASYVGVRAVFGVSGWRSRLWFLILPCLVYLSALSALFVALLAADGSAPA